METIMVKNRMQLIKERINSKSINGLTHIKLDTFEDHRGEIWTIYSEDYCDYKFVYGIVILMCTIVIFSHTIRI